MAPRWPRRDGCSLARLLLATALVWEASGCSHIEPARFAVSELEVSGQRQMARQPLLECLVTRERPALTLRLGTRRTRCNEPPFDSEGPRLELWTWSWTEWHTFNRGVFEQDLERVLRWYRARGFYDARIVDVVFDPPEAGRGLPCRRDDCRVALEVSLEEGEPTRIRSVELSGTQGLTAEVVRQLHAALSMRVGERFDEVDYDRSREALLNVLRRSSFAAARVRGAVEVVSHAHAAYVRFDLRPGKPYRFRHLRVSGQGSLPTTPIRLAAGLGADEIYRPERLEAMRDEVLALGAFSAVEIEQHRDDQAGAVDLTVKVTPLEQSTLRLGFGMTSGASRRDETGDLDSIPQWDVHLFVRYELRHVFGTLGALHVEDQPKLIFGRVFPAVTTPELGNELSLRWNQPGLLEARTDLFSQASWDYGPDPFLDFRRSDISVRVGARRGFFDRHLLGTFALQQDVFIVPSDADNVTSDGSPTPSSYLYAFLEQDLRLDLRDHPRRPTQGAYLLLNVTEAPRFFASDWTSVRLAPEARFYLPLPLETVLAWRAALGALFIYANDDELDEISRRLGPSAYRLRGGGANSVRGFLPGKLGDSDQGGLRRWESMLEWRLRFGESLGLTLFADLGDVSESSSFRFGHLNTTLGFGLRYYTPIGPIRLDLGLRIPSWQRSDGSPGIEDDADTLQLTSLPGALHFTIGDSF